MRAAGPSDGPYAPLPERATRAHCGPEQYRCGPCPAKQCQDSGTLLIGAWADMIHVGVDGPHFVTGLDVPETNTCSPI